MTKHAVALFAVLLVPTACGDDSGSEPQTGTEGMTSEGSATDDPTSGGPSGNTDEPDETGETGQPDETGEPSETCGDGMLDPGEECDDGNDDDTDACTNACTLGEGDAFFHTCGAGGATGDWTTFEVPYPPGTTLADGTPVDSAIYDVLAPPPGDTPLPLVVVLHGDEGSPNIVKNQWEGLWQSEQSFVLVAPHEPHQQVDGGNGDNGWDNYQPETDQFLRTMLDDVGPRYDIDIERVYGTGVSAGAWIGGRLFYRFQNVFAAVQLSCGSAGSPDYIEPTDPSCRLPTRFEIAADDFLYSSAESNAEALMGYGNEVEFSTTACSGHCCGGAFEYADLALDFFEARALCGGGIGGGCGGFATDL